MTRADAIEILRAARARIERGWCQGVWHKSCPDRYCAIGALTKSGLSVWICPRLLSCEDPVSFNDAPERTKEDVLQLFSRAMWSVPREGI